MGPARGSGLFATRSACYTNLVMELMLRLRPTRAMCATWILAHQHHRATTTPSALGAYSWRAFPAPLRPGARAAVARCGAASFAVSATRQPLEDAAAYQGCRSHHDLLAGGATPRLGRGPRAEAARRAYGRQRGLAVTFGDHPTINRPGHPAHAPAHRPVSRSRVACSWRRWVARPMGRRALYHTEFARAADRASVS